MSGYDDGVSFEALERAAQRNAKRVDPKSVEPVQVRTLRDIQAVVAEFAPDRQRDGDPLTIRTRMRGENEQGNKELFEVSAVTQSKSRRTQLLEGLETIKNYRHVVDRSREQTIPVTVNGVPMSPPALSEGNPSVYIDPLIRRWMGGRRQGLRVCWQLDDGYTYYYDVYEHKLTRSTTGGEQS